MECLVIFSALVSMEIMDVVECFACRLYKPQSIERIVGNLRSKMSAKIKRKEKNCLQQLVHLAPENSKSTLSSYDPVV